MGAGRLESWKEVAAYLKRDVRTAQRWERSEGLPVHRHLHAGRGSIHAFTSEIDAWRRAREAAGAPDTGRVATRWFWAAGLLVAVASAALALWARGAAVPSPGAGARTPAAWDPPRVLAALTQETGNVAWIQVGRGNHPMALTPDGRELYVASTEGGVQVIDTTRQIVTDRIEASRPYELVMDAGGTRVYVGQGHGDVLAIDTRTKKVTRIPTHARVRDLALGRDGRTLYIAGTYAGLLAADTRDGSIRRISSLPCPMHLALSPDGRHLYVSYQCGGPGGRSGHDTVDVIDTATEESVGVIRGLASVGGDIAVAPGGEQVWIDGTDACTAPSYDHAGCPAVPGPVLNVVRTSDRLLLRSLSAGDVTGFGARLAFTPDGTRVVASGRGTQVFGTASLLPLESTPLLVTGRIVFAPDGRTAYVPIGDDRIAVVPLLRQMAMPAGLSGRWTGDGTSNDALGLAHGVAEGTVSFAPGRIGQAFVFDGRGRLRVDGIANVGITHRPFTVVAWVRFAPVEADHGMPGAPATLIDRLVERPDGSRGWRLMRDADGRLLACLGGPGIPCAPDRGTAVASDVRLGNDRWHHVGFTWDGRAAALYVDGRADTRGALAFHDDEEQLLRFGADERGRFPMRGRVDEIEIYERALEPDEIAARATGREP